MRLSVALTILGMAAATYSSRVGLIGLARQIELHPIARRALEYVPLSILAALVFPAVIAPSGAMESPLSNPTLWAALITAAVHATLKRPVVSILVGVASMVLFRQVFGL